MATPPERSADPEASPGVPAPNRPPPSHDYPALARLELAELARLADLLSPAQLDTASLCEGWLVRDVFAHICSAATQSPVSLVAGLFAAGLRPNRALRSWALAYADGQASGELGTVLHRLAGADHLGSRLVRAFVRPDELLVDYVIHRGDITTALSLPCDVPSDRLLAALDAAPRICGLMRCKQRARHLNLLATDVSWSCGRGPTVSGPGAALLQAISVRPAGLPLLEGPGTATLAARVGRP